MNNTRTHARARTRTLTSFILLFKSFLKTSDKTIAIPAINSRMQISPVL